MSSQELRSCEDGTLLSVKRAGLLCNALSSQEQSSCEDLPFDRTDLRVKFRQVNSPYVNILTIASKYAIIEAQIRCFDNVPL